MNDSIQEGKTAAIISYLWWPGLIIAFVMNNKAQNSFTSFHIRQSIGLSILSFGIGLLTKFGIPTIADILFLGFFVFWIIGILGAIKGIEKPIPYIGELFQDWFKNI
jgi:uncharacterized membrane protein|tara:strand:- start:7487 stop:7807 length:321 start_codon:yes stop_codon:yes gene_type:complete